MNIDTIDVIKVKKVKKNLAKSYFYIKSII